jgi:hypothetical protein
MRGGNSFPYLLRPDDSLPGDERGIRWRLVAEADDFFEAMAVLELLHRRHGQPLSVV